MMPKSVPLTSGRSYLAAAVALAALAVAAPAQAGSFRVSPIHVTLAPDRATTEVLITNSDSAPVAVRVTALRWTQVDGVDVHAETGDVIASPPIFTIAPGATQRVRIGLRSRAAGAAYRLILEEIPAGHSGGSGIRVALKLDLPFYVTTRGGAPALSWTATRDAAGLLTVEARNAGAGHSQVIGIEALDAAGAQIGSTEAMGVVLPGSMRRWTLGTGQGVPAALLVRGPLGITRSPVVVERR